jgi:hypothetical protein
MAERKEALDRWGTHVTSVVLAAVDERFNSMRKVAWLSPQTASPRFGELLI